MNFNIKDMKKNFLKYRKIIWVSIFAIAMAYLESSIVVYLRRLYGIVDYTMGPPPFDPVLAPIEAGREFATMIMLIAVGWAVGKSTQDRIGYAFLIFGLWDIFYYFWLWVFIRWPKSLVETDILFLIPLPWWGPVIAPMLIALLMVIGGILAVRCEDEGRIIVFSRLDWICSISGIVLLLYSFMRDAVKALPAGVEEISQLRPTPFNWGIYIIGYILLSYGILHVILDARPKEI